MSWNILRGCCSSLSRRRILEIRRIIAPAEPSFIRVPFQARHCKVHPACMCQVPGYIPGTWYVFFVSSPRKSTTLLVTFAIAKYFLRNTLLSADVRHRVSLVVLPLRGAAVFGHAGALRRAFQLRKKPVRTSDAVRFCRRSRRVLVRVDRTGGTVLHSTAFFLLAIGPFWAL